MAAVDSREFAAWRAYDRIDPIGDQAIRCLLATFCAFYFNAHRSGDVGGASAYDFMPWVEKPTEKPLDEETVKRQMMWAGLMK